MFTSHPHHSPSDPTLLSLHISQHAEQPNAVYTVMGQCFSVCRGLILPLGGAAVRRSLLLRAAQLCLCRLLHVRSRGLSRRPPPTPLHSLYMFLHHRRAKGHSVLADRLTHTHTYIDKQLRCQGSACKGQRTTTVAWNDSISPSDADGTFFTWTSVT